LLHQARERLYQLRINNARLRLADGSLGWPEHAPYDAIVVTAAAPKTPKPLLDQLAAGGRLVIPVGPTSYFQDLIRIRRVGEYEYRTEQLCGVRFVPLIGVEGW